MESRSGKGKLQYSRPELVDITRKGAAGEDLCDNGSGAADMCDTGAAAGAFCMQGEGGEEIIFPPPPE